MNENRIKLLLLGGISLAAIYYFTKKNKLIVSIEKPQNNEILPTEIPTGIINFTEKPYNIKESIKPIEELPVIQTEIPTEIINFTEKPYNIEESIKPIEELPVIQTEIPTVNSKSSRYGFGSGYAAGVGSTALLTGIFTAYQYRKYKQYLKNGPEQEL